MIPSYVLTKAIESNDVETVINLLRQGVELNPLYDLSPLAEATRRGNLDLMKLLIKAGADVNFQMEEGYTALMDAALAGNLDAVKILVEAGADVNIKDIYQEHALSIAAHNAHEEVFNYLEPLTIPKWEPGARVLAEAKRRKSIRNVKGVWVDTSGV